MMKDAMRLWLAVAGTIVGGAAVLSVPESESATAPVAADTAAIESEVAVSEPVSREEPATEAVLLAERFEALEREMSEMRALLAAARLRIQESTPPVRAGRLGELERKALAYEASRGQVKYKDAVIASLQADVKEAREREAAQRRKLREKSGLVAALTARVSALQNENAQTRKALDLLRLGQYEYYEVKEGDTVESIAAQTTVYGDAARHVAIRQANRGHVEDMDRLVPGEVLIIPRFSTSTRHEF